MAAQGKHTLRDRAKGLPMLFVGGLILFNTSVERFLLILNEPNVRDANRDGVFTISDIPGNIWDILVAPGVEFESLLADSEIGVFLELSATNPNWFFSIIVTSIVYKLFYGGLSEVFGFDIDF